MTDEDDNIARYQRPPREGQFKPGLSGNPLGHPKGSKNDRTYVNEHLNKKIPIIEGGKTRKAPRAEAIAIWLVNQAPKGSPKALPPLFASRANLTRRSVSFARMCWRGPKTRSSLRASSLASGQETPLRRRIRFPDAPLRSYAPTR
jgi:hypothetical protein